jgi:hypothetical protein
LAAGADPDVADATGHSPVTAAVAIGNPPLLKQLIEWGGNPNGTAMMPSLVAALAANRSTVMVSLLLAQGADVTAALPDGRPFNQPLERFLGHLEAESFARREITGMVLSHATELAIHDALGDHPVAAPKRASRSSLAL